MVTVMSQSGTVYAFFYQVGTVAVGMSFCGAFWTYCNVGEAVFCRVGFIVVALETNLDVCKNLLGDLSGGYSGIKGFEASSEQSLCWGGITTDDFKKMGFVGNFYNVFNFDVRL